MNINVLGVHFLTISYIMFHARYFFRFNQQRLPIIAVINYIQFMYRNIRLRIDSYL